jgi:hypothetical protein
MVNLDDPFDKDADGYHNLRLQYERRRFTEEPLDTVQVKQNGSRPPVTVVYSTISGDAQTTLSKDTGFPSSRKLLSREKDPQLRRLIRKQDYGSYFFTKRVSLAKLPDRVSYAGDFAGVIHDSMEGWRWPCVDVFDTLRYKDWEQGLKEVIYPTLSELFYWGGEGISRTLPTVPESSLVTALGELARDLPQLPGVEFRKKPTLGGAASEFLNWTFGISPTLNDAASIGSATINADSILDQYRRDSNRLIRRRLELLDESSTTTEQHLAYQYPFGYIYIDPLRNALTPCVHRTTLRKRVWFSGAYQYDFPHVDTYMAKLKEFNRLYGVVPTPEDVWNLIPWSWLLDWQANFGSVIRNLSTLSRDGIQTHHAYLMCEIIKTTEYSNSGNTCTIQETSRNRVKASPFGFGFRPGSLDNKQKAILTALGTSRWL